MNHKVKAIYNNMLSRMPQDYIMYTLYKESWSGRDTKELCQKILKSL